MLAETARRDLEPLFPLAGPAPPFQSARPLQRRDLARFSYNSASKPCRFSCCLDVEFARPSRLNDPQSRGSLIASGSSMKPENLGSSILRRCASACALRSQTEQQRWPSAKETIGRNTRDALRSRRKKGWSRSAARGHPRAGERQKPPSGKTLVDPHSREEQAAEDERCAAVKAPCGDASNHYRMSFRSGRGRTLKETTGADPRERTLEKSSTIACGEFHVLLLNGAVMSPLG